MQPCQPQFLLGTVMNVQTNSVVPLATDVLQQTMHGRHDVSSIAVCCDASAATHQDMPVTHDVVTTDDKRSQEMHDIETAQ